jgi:hypothetical protein
MARQAGGEEIMTFALFDYQEEALAASVDTRTPAEITAQERKELEHLRSLAREYKLPMGDTE